MSPELGGLYAFPDLYDAQYRAYREDLAFYRWVVGAHGGPVLEIGCGTGRITVELARMGVRVVGVDASGAMLARARRRIDEAGVGDAVELIEADMRQLPRLDDVLDGGFFVAIAPFNTLMHAYTLEDQDRTLRGIFGQLVPGGMFAADVYVPRFGALGVVRAEPTWQRVMGPDADLFVVQEHDPARQRIVSTYLIDRIDESDRVRRQRAQLVQRYFTRFELERAVAAAGFEGVDIYGSFERIPFRESSEVIAVLARKPAS